MPQNFQMIIFWAAVSKLSPLSHSQSQIPIINLENREFIIITIIGIQKFVIEFHLNHHGISQLSSHKRIQTTRIQSGVNFCGFTCFTLQNNSWKNYLHATLRKIVKLLDGIFFSMECVWIPKKWLQLLTLNCKITCSLRYS